MDLGLQGKAVLVTGASKGIGKAIAEEFAKEGARVSICARGERDLAAAATDLERYDVRVLATVADVTRAEDTQRTIDATVAAFGRLDVLVNNAGDIAMGRTVAAAGEQWRETLEVNLLSAVRFTRAAVPHRLSGAHCCVNLS